MVQKLLIGRLKRAGGGRPLAKSNESIIVDRVVDDYLRFESFGQFERIADSALRKVGKVGWSENFLICSIAPPAAMRSSHLSSV
jgi:hypothetical protein